MLNTQNAFNRLSNNRGCLTVHLLDSVSALALVYSGLIHLSNPYLFAAKIVEYGIVPKAMLSWWPVGLACLMTTVGLALFAGKGSISIRLVALSMFAGFTLVQAHALISGAEFGCGCFGYSSEPISLKSLSIPLGLTMTSLLTICLTYDRRGSTAGASIESASVSC